MEQNKIYFVAVIHNFMQFIFVNLFLNAISGTKLDAFIFVILSSNVGLSSSEVSSLNAMYCSSKLIILKKD